MVSGVVLSTGLFYLLSTFVLSRDTAVPLLFEAADSGPFGINSSLLFSYVPGVLASDAFFYGVGLGRLVTRFGTGDVRRKRPAGHPRIDPRWTGSPNLSPT